MEAARLVSFGRGAFVVVPRRTAREFGVNFDEKYYIHVNILLRSQPTLPQELADSLQ